MIKVAEVVCCLPSPLPIITKRNCPVDVDGDVDIDSVEVPVGVTGFKLKLDAAPVGRPDTLNETGAVHPLNELTVTAKVVD